MTKKMLRADTLLWRFKLAKKTTKADEDLKASGLSLFHMTAGHQMAPDFATLCDNIIDSWDLLDANNDWLFPVRTIADLDKLGGDRIGVIFGLQNADQVSAVPSRVESLWRLGIRVMQLTYNEANPLGDGCEEKRGAGLTKRGQDVVREANRSGIILDVSHAGPATAKGVVEASKQSVVASHAFRRDRIMHPRNLPDDVLLAVAKSGGIIGLPTWGPILWDRDPKHPPTLDLFIDELKGMIDKFGEDAVTIASDLPIFAYSTPQEERALIDGMIKAHPDLFGPYCDAFGHDFRDQYCKGFNQIREWSTLPESLTKAGITGTTLEKVLAGNWLRVCMNVWSTRERKVD